MKLARFAPAVLCIILVGVHLPNSSARQSLLSAGSSAIESNAQNTQHGRSLSDTSTAKGPSGDGLPTVGEGQLCGAEVGICGGTLCCSMGGVCGASIDFCGYGCRDNFGKCFIVNEAPKPSGSGNSTGSSAPSKNGKGGMSTAVIIIIVGAAAGAILLLILAILLLRRCRQTADEPAAVKSDGIALAHKNAEDGAADPEDIKSEKDQACCVSFFCGIPPEGGEQDQTIATGNETKAVEGTALNANATATAPPGLVIPVQSGYASSVLSPAASAGVLSPGIRPAPSVVLSPTLSAAPAGVLSPVGSRALSASVDSMGMPPRPQRNLFAEAMAHLDGMGSLGSPAASQSLGGVQPAGPTSLRASVESVNTNALNAFARTPQLLSKGTAGDETDDDTKVKYVHVIKESAGPENVLHSGAYCPACQYGSCTVHAPAPGRPQSLRGAHSSATGSDVSERNRAMQIGAAFEMMQKANANEGPMAPTTPKRTSRVMTSHEEDESEVNSLWSSEVSNNLSLTIIPNRPKSPGHSSRPRSPGSRSPHHARSPSSKSKSPYAPRSPHSYQPRSPGRPGFPHQPRSPHHRPKSPGHPHYSQQPRSPHHTYAPGQFRPKSPALTYTSRPVSPALPYMSRPRSPPQPSSPGAQSARSSRSMRSVSPARSSSSRRSASPARSSRSGSPTTAHRPAHPSYRAPGPAVRMERSPFAGRDEWVTRGPEFRAEEFYAGKRMMNPPPRKQAEAQRAAMRRGMVLGAGDDSDDGDDLGFFMPNPAGSGGMGGRM